MDEDNQFFAIIIGGFLIALLIISASIYIHQTSILNCQQNLIKVIGTHQAIQESTLVKIKEMCSLK